MHLPDRHPPCPICGLPMSGDNCERCGPSVSGAELAAELIADLCLFRAGPTLHYRLNGWQTCPFLPEHLTHVIRIARPALRRADVELVTSHLCYGGLVPTSEIISHPFLLPSPQGPVLADAGRPVPTEFGPLTWIGSAPEPSRTGAFGELLDSFPWAHPSHRQAWESIVFSLLFPTVFRARPLVLVVSHEQGTGKTWLVQTLGAALNAAVLPETLDAANFHRRLVAQMLRSRIVCFDNVVGSGFKRVDSDLLSQIFSAPVISTPALYRVGVEEVRSNHLFTLTLNQGQVSRDLMTRALAIQLDFESPEQYTRVMTERTRRGQDYWLCPSRARAVLADILALAIEAGNPRIEIPDNFAADCFRPAEWWAYHYARTSKLPLPLDLEFCGDLFELHEDDRRLLHGRPHPLSELLALARSRRLRTFALLRAAHDPAFFEAVLSRMTCMLRIASDSEPFFNVL